MSHFSHLEMKLKDMSLVRQLCASRGWTAEVNEQYRDDYGNSMTGGHVIRDGAGKVKALIQASGTVTVDPYYMGRQYQDFLQDYAQEHIKYKAVMEGATVRDKGRDAQGNLLLEVVY